MEGTVRISCVLHRVITGDCEKSMAYALKAVSDASGLNPDIIVLPRLSLIGASCGSLLSNGCLINDCMKAVEKIAEETAGINSYIFTCAPILQNGGKGVADIVLHSGKILSVTPENALHPIFDCGGVKVAFISGNPVNLPVYAAQYIKMGARLVVNSSAQPVSVGYIKRAREAAAAFSTSANCAVSLCNGNIGESTSPYVYQGFAGTFELGEELVWQVHSNSFFSANADIDRDIVNSGPLTFSGGGSEPEHYHLLNDKKSILRAVNTNPFLPANVMDRVSATVEYFDLQVRSLVGRMKNAGIKKMVIGCSGGLDSTLALLVACAAAEQMLFKRSSIIAVSMPGFGTGGRTRENVNGLLDALDVDKREISIVKSVTQHLEDINHSLDNYDTAFENAQARERTQILFDLANTENALVIGTGDLSEAALGWCTFGGDHLSGFNVNASITKNTARQIVKYLSESPSFADTRDILLDILDTPVSPELLPDTDGASPQRTEEIIGSYDLHDFFLFYFVKYNMPFSKIYRYALYNFEGIYEDEYILKCLKIFITRFIKSQFKRSCSAESAAVGPLSLSPSEYLIPSDASADFFLSELDRSLTDVEPK